MKPEDVNHQLHSKRKIQKTLLPARERTVLRVSKSQRRLRTGPRTRQKDNKAPQSSAPTRQLCHSKAQSSHRERTPP